MRCMKGLLVKKKKKKVELKVRIEHVVGVSGHRCGVMLNSNRFNLAVIYHALHRQCYVGMFI